MDFVVSLEIRGALVRASSSGGGGLSFERVDDARGKRVATKLLKSFLKLVEAACGEPPGDFVFTGRQGLKVLYTGDRLIFLQDERTFAWWFTHALGLAPETFRCEASLLPKFKDFPERLAESLIESRGSLRARFKTLPARTFEEVSLAGAALPPTARSLRCSCQVL